MHSALLLVDVQNDYLNHPALTPPACILVENIARLLSACRAAGIPVFHSQTLVNPDGSDRMPHWKAKDYWACVAGTEGAQAPAGLEPHAGEQVFRKPFYSPFGNPALAEALHERRVSTLIVVGVHTHACIRSTVVDAYQEGFAVLVPEDGVASYDPLSGSLSLDYLDGRACQVTTIDEMLGELGIGAAPIVAEQILPAGRTDGEWMRGSERRLWTQHNPGNWEEVISHVALATEADVDAGVMSAVRVQPEWGSRSRTERSAAILAWSDRLQERQDAFIQLVAREIGKPRYEAQAEFDWALSLMRATAKRVALEGDEPFTESGLIRHRPLGTVGLITPWNNPLAIAAGKLAPALAYGNTVVWKPALPAPRTSFLLLAALDEAGIPPGCVNLVLGDAQTGSMLTRHPGVAAVSFTGSSLNGRHLASQCAISGKLLQAELGGNNAVVVMDCDDPASLARDLAHAMFSYAGQRCTAPRRLIVAQHLQARLKNALVEAIQALRMGDATEAATDVGPLISRDAQMRMAALVDDAQRAGAQLLCGGQLPRHLQHGCWYPPTLVDSPSPKSRVVREEAFGPVAVWLDAVDFDEAVRLCNEVDQGLVATLISANQKYQQQFLDRAEAGILRINQLKGLHPDAPFVGWKTSGIGPPEHGTGDRLFYTRMQAVYAAGG